jgi:hypothetical protein
MSKLALFGVAAATAFLGMAAESRDARAYDYPYCAVAGGHEAYENCGYQTLQQCRAAVSGVGGHCQQNPRYIPDQNAFDESLRRDVRRPR